MNTTTHTTISTTASACVQTGGGYRALRARSLTSANKFSKFLLQKFSSEAPEVKACVSEFISCMQDLVSGMQEFNSRIQETISRIPKFRSVIQNLSSCAPEVISGIPVFISRPPEFISGASEIISERQKPSFLIKITIFSLKNHLLWHV